MKDPYVYEELDENGKEVLKNKLNIHNYEKLRQAEADISFVKLLDVDQKVPCNKFGVDYLKSINKYVLGDVFDWAGNFRKIQMEKAERVLDGESVQFSYPSDIEKDLKKVINEINAINWNSLDTDKKSMTFTKLIAQLWQVHPFRDGNTRTTVTYAFRFAEEHGFPMDRNLILNNFDYVRDSLVMASIGEYSDYEYLNKIIKEGIERKAQGLETKFIDKKISKENTNRKNNSTQSDDDGER